MQLDVRKPLGLLFVILGALLTAVGVLGDAALYRPSLGVNVNLGWGPFMMLFGALCLSLAQRRRA